MKVSEKEYVLVVLRAELKRLKDINANTGSTSAQLKADSVDKAITFFKNADLKEKPDNGLEEDFTDEEIIKIDNALKNLKNGRSNINRRQK